MILKPLTFLFMLIFIGLLFLTNIAFADEPLSFIQDYNSTSETTIEGVSANKALRQHLKNMLFEQSLDQYFSYELDVNRSTGIKVHSSLGLKVRSDETILQFRMTF